MSEINNVEIRVHAKTDNALQGLKTHYKESNKPKHRVGMKAYGIKQVLKDRTLKITFGGLMKKIMRKGGSVGHLKQQMKDDLVKNVTDGMKKNGVEPDEYEVTFHEQ